MANKHQRVSAHYNLTGSQSTFDFVDVRILGDTPLFIDPTALSRINSVWANACTSAVQSFFQSVLDAIRKGDSSEALRLLSYLGEDNSTRLGYSRSSKGSGVGDGLAQAFYSQLATSKAIATGLITDIEDTALLIEGIREDRISDIATNILRRQLAEYTQFASRFYGIPLVANVSLGHFWDTHKRDWLPLLTELPIPRKGGPLLLVPKSIARQVLFRDPGQYFRHYVLEYFKTRELDAKSPITFLLKDGGRRVYKRDVDQKYRQRHDGAPGVEKRINLEATTLNPDLLKQFKLDMGSKPPVSDPSVIAMATDTQLPDYDDLLNRVMSLSPGNPDAHSYERAVEALLNALFYPSLVDPIRQEAIHGGRKRIDISYTNAANTGFFDWISQHYAAANIVVECKNYSRPIANPEYDQIAGRFSPSRGQVGLLVYRSYEDKPRVQESCRDTAKDGRGYILALDDGDLQTLVSEAKSGSPVLLTGLLRARFRHLTS
jgi:hypothetical protein